MTKHVFVGCAVLLAVAACGSEATGPGGTPTTRPEPVVVYAAHEDPTYWPGVFAAFTRDTGIRVTVRQRDAATLVDEVIANRGSPPADVLLTPSVYGVWRAADEGALRPLQSELIAATVAETLRDPDGYWAAVRIRDAQVVHAPDFRDGAGIESFADLGDPAFKGQLCVTTASLPLNRMLIATQIAALGVRDAELAVRRWMANLALPPFDDEASLRDAIAGGTCRLGILSSDFSAGLPVIGDVAAGRPVVDIDGIGIARHAREPVSALRLIEWLLGPGAGLPPLTSDTQPVARAAWRISEAIDLAERAGYR